MIRFFDILISLAGIILLLPLFMILIIIVGIDLKGHIFYNQYRVGKNNINFRLHKLRTMRLNSEKGGLLTIGKYDRRITWSGTFIRKYKIDELPQLVNVLKGEMSMVGPRPEVRKYVDLYTSDQMRVLQVKPGITDMASIHYSNENEILKKYSDPERAYIDFIMGDKIKLNMYYINNYNIKTYFRILFITAFRIFRSDTYNS